MRNEIIKLLKKEGKLSDKTIEELEDVNIQDFSNVVRNWVMKKPNISDLLKSQKT